MSVNWEMPVSVVNLVNGVMDSTDAKKGEKDGVIIYNVKSGGVHNGGCYFSVDENGIPTHPTSKGKFIVVNTPQHVFFGFDKLIGATIKSVNYRSNNCNEWYDAINSDNSKHAQDPKYSEECHRIVLETDKGPFFIDVAHDDGERFVCGRTPKDAKHKMSLSHAFEWS